MSSLTVRLVTITWVFFFFFGLNQFLCYSLTQYAFSIYNCPFHSWKPLLVLGNFSSCKACLRRRIQGLCGPYVSQPHFLCCIYVCRRCKMQIIRSFILSNPNSMKELRDLVEAPESEVEENGRHGTVAMKARLVIIVRKSLCEENLNLMRWRNPPPCPPNCLCRNRSPRCLLPSLIGIDIFVLPLSTPSLCLIHTYLSFFFFLRERVAQIGAVDT
jgi:hypothetical protein